MYLTEKHLAEMAGYAVTTYEFSCSWRQAGEAAREYARDTWGVRATRSQVALAVLLAQTAWEGYRADVARELH